MIELQECKDKCFANEIGRCTILDEIPCFCGSECPFYKPRGCRDWIRVKYHGQEVLFPPEEYERKFKNEEDTQTDAVYWRIKVLPKG